MSIVEVCEDGWVVVVYSATGWRAYWLCCESMDVTLVEEVDLDSDETMNVSRLW